MSVIFSLRPRPRRDWALLDVEVKIGEMLLNIEARIGELLPTAKEALANVAGKRGQPRSGPRPRSLPDDITEKRAQQARHIKDNPSAVAAIIKEAEESEDIPKKGPGGQGRVQEP